VAKLRHFSASSCLPSLYRNGQHLSHKLVGFYEAHGLATQWRSTRVVGEIHRLMSTRVKYWRISLNKVSSDIWNSPSLTLMYRFAGPKSNGSRALAAFLFHVQAIGMYAGIVRNTMPQGE